MNAVLNGWLERAVYRHSMLNNGYIESLTKSEVVNLEDLTNGEIALLLLNNPTAAINFEDKELVITRKLTSEEQEKEKGFLLGNYNYFIMRIKRACEINEQNRLDVAQYLFRNKIEIKELKEIVK